MYILTSIICSMAANGITVKSEAALNDIERVMKLVFTPVNSMVLLASLGNIACKLKEKAITSDKAGKRIVIVLIIFVLILMIESNYMGGFISGLLGK